MNQVQAKAAYSFNVEQNGSDYVFNYKLPQFTGRQILGVFALCAIVCIAVSVATAANGPAGLIIWLLLSIGICVWHAFSRQSKFTITPTHVILNGKSYDRAHINKFFVEEKFTEQADFHFICFRYGEQKIKITGSMKKDSAEVMYNKIISVMKEY